MIPIGRGVHAELATLTLESFDVIAGSIIETINKSSKKPKDRVVPSRAGRLFRWYLPVLCKKDFIDGWWAVAVAVRAYSNWIPVHRGAHWRVR